MAIWGTIKGLLLQGRFRRLIGSEAWALADQSVVSAANFLTSVMLARYMGLREFGIFALAWMTVLFANSMQNALIVAPMMSVGPKQEDKDRPAYFGAVFFHALLLILLCFLIVFTVCHAVSGLFHQVDLRHLALPLAAAVIAYQGQDFVRRYFFATRQNRQALAGDMLSYPTQLPIIFLLHGWVGLNSANALWTMAATSLFGLAAAGFWVEPLRLERHWIGMVWRRHWKISRWLAGSSLLQWTSSNLFVVAAPVYYGAAAAGVLKASQTLIGVTHVWFQGLDNIVPAETSRRLHDGGVHTMLAYTRSILVKWGGLTLVYAGVMGAAPALWLSLVYGPQMAQYGSILRLYALLYVFTFVGGPLRAGLQALEFTGPIFWSYLAMTAFAVAFAVPAAKWFGLQGTMAGLIGTQMLFQSIIAIALLVRTRRVLNENSSHCSR